MAEPTKREKLLEKLLRETWQALPDFLQDDQAGEIDWKKLGNLAGKVGKALEHAWETPTHG